MACRLLEEARSVLDGTALGVVGSKNKASDTRRADGADAHRARF
jgi:hypothetical protein